MIINHNMNALNAHRNMTANTNSAGKSMEKLSSGLRINRAGDDAAGLAISEKMRGQIRGLDQASRNAQDGISLIQTAEGALNETHNILQRMRELSVQSANDTNIAEDRAAIQEEMNALSQEITRISEQTEFNKQTLLNGDFDGTFHIGANQGQDISLSIGAMDAKSLGVQGEVLKSTEVTGATNIEVRSNTGEKLSIEFKLAGNDVAETTAKFSKADGKITVTMSEKSGNGTATEADIKAALDKIAGNAGITVSVKEGATLGNTAITTAPGLTNVNTTVLDEDASKEVGINVTSQEKASKAIETLDKAITTVSEQRSKLGAVQNRLEHTTANLNNTSENLTAAESRVRDVDMAKEMMNFSKNNILSQAAQAMLAQANKQPQGVLQLLR